MKNIRGFIDEIASQQLAITDWAVKIIVSGTRLGRIIANHPQSRDRCFFERSQFGAVVEEMVTSHSSPNCRPGCIFQSQLESIEMEIENLFALRPMNLHRLCPEKFGIKFSALSDSKKREPVHLRTLRSIDWKGLTRFPRESCRLHRSEDLPLGIVPIRLGRPTQFPTLKNRHHRHPGGSLITRDKRYFHYVGQVIPKARKELKDQ